MWMCSSSWWRDTSEHNGHSHWFDSNKTPETDSSKLMSLAEKYSNSETTQIFFFPPSLTSQHPSIPASWICFQCSSNKLFVPRVNWQMECTPNSSRKPSSFFNSFGVRRPLCASLTLSFSPLNILLLSQTCSFTSGAWKPAEVTVWR